MSSLALGNIQEFFFLWMGEGKKAKQNLLKTAERWPPWWKCCLRKDAGIDVWIFEVFESQDILTRFSQFPFPVWILGHFILSFFFFPPPPTPFLFFVFGIRYFRSQSLSDATPVLSDSIFPFSLHVFPLDFYQSGFVCLWDFAFATRQIFLK